MNKEEIINILREELGLVNYFNVKRYLANLDTEIIMLQEETKQLKERVEYLERSNNRREDEILFLRQELIDKEEKIDKAIELLGKYKHYCVPDEIRNRENEELVEKAYEILKGEENE